MMLCRDKRAGQYKISSLFLLKKAYMHLCWRRKFPMHASEGWCLRMSVISQMIESQWLLWNTYAWLLFANSIKRVGLLFRWEYNLEDCFQIASSFSYSLGKTTLRRQSKFCILKLCTRCQIRPYEGQSHKWLLLSMILPSGLGWTVMQCYVTCIPNYKF